jgi:two-component system nitrate/nitrite response regulator NarL
MSLLLCDDHLLLLDALAAALSARGQQVLAVVTHPGEVAEAAAQLDPDVCLLDVYFPDGDGIQAAREVRRRAPRTRVLMLSASSNPDIVRDAFAAGAVGFVQKDEDIDAILAAVAMASKDEVVLRPGLLHAVLRPSPEEGRRAGPDQHWLTARETDVLSRLVAGESTSTIAKGLGMATSTTRTHIQNVLVKLGVHSRLQAVAYATSHRLLDPERGPAAGPQPPQRPD